MEKRETEELLIRLDEKVANIWRVLDEQEFSVSKQIDKLVEGQKTQNGNILKNTIWRKVIVGVGGSSVLLIAGWLAKLTFGG